MPKEIIESHLSSHAEKQAVDAICSAYEEVRGAARNVNEAKKEALRARFQWGKTIFNAVQRDCVNKSDVYDEIDKRLDKDRSYISHHKRFAERCVEEYAAWVGGDSEAVEGYITEAEDKDWNLSWSRAVRWISSDTEETEDDPDEEIDRLIKDVEHHLEKVDEKLSELEQRASEGQVPKRLEDTAESVTVAARQDMEDVVDRLTRLPDAAPERVEDPEYLEWLRKNHACVSCGVQGDGMTAHHLREYVAEVGIAMTVDDYKTLPLCPFCHRELEDMPSITFWEEGTAVSDPPALADEMAAEFLRLVRTDQL